MSERKQRDEHESLTIPGGASAATSRTPRRCGRCGLRRYSVEKADLERVTAFRYTDTAVLAEIQESAIPADPRNAGRA